MILRLGLILFACLSVGCAGQTGTAFHDRLAALSAFTVTDLSMATSILSDGGDKAGAMCLGYLTEKATALAAQPVAPPPDLNMPISDLARIRVAIHSKSIGPSFFEDLDYHCAALRTSLEIDAAKGAMLLSGIVASGGASAPDAAMKALPVLLRLIRP